MGMSREEIDRLIDAHFAFEANDDIAGVMASLAPEAEHLVIPSPAGTLQERGQIRAFYEMLFASIKGEGVTPLRRLYGEAFVVDEVLWNGEIADGRPFLCAGKSGKVSFRMLHIFEFEGGKISRENVWCDLAAIQQQLGCRVS